MRSKIFTITFTAIFLTLFTVSSLAIMLVGYSTYTSYSNPYSYVPTTPVSSIPSWGNYVNHTVIFVLDGVRPDIADRIDLPYIKSITTWANFTDVQCSTLLSVSRTGYCVMTSGVNSTESLVVSNDYNTLFKADSLWSVALRHSNTTAVVGGDDWQVMFGSWLNYSVTVNATMPGEASFVFNRTNSGIPIVTKLDDYRDSFLATYAGQVVQKYKPSFMVVHFSETDKAAHYNGTINPDGSLSESYVRAIQNEDTYIKWILGNYTAAGILSSTLVVVASDHGQVNKGGHGGTEPEVLHTLLLMNSSKGVIPGKYNDLVHQNSIAPTVAALMGWEVPSDASGTILFEGVSLTPMQEAIYRINLANIRLAQANITMLKMGYSEPYQTTLEGAAQSLTWAIGNYSAADYVKANGAAVSSESASRNVLDSLFAAKTSEEISSRVILATMIIVVVAILLALLFYKFRGKVKGLVVGEKLFLLDLVISVILFFVLLIVFTILTGWVFSGSYFPDSPTAVLVGVFTPTLLTLVSATFVFMVVLLYFNKKAPKSNSRVVTWTAIFLLAIVTVYIAGMISYIARNGIGLPWYAHDIGEATGYFYMVISAVEFSLSALIGFLGGLGVSRLLGRGGKGKKK